MSPAFAQRLVVLAAVALLTVVGVLVIAELADNSAPEPQEERSVPAPGGGWFQSIAAPYRLKTRPKRTVCGFRARPKTLGVAHPVLPCNTKLYLSYGGKEALTQVIDRGTGTPGREFELTAALALELDLRGVQAIRWRYARR
jgi:hypothetical protein